jgi:poly-gamma-glutamate synthesis protein (capsule biosynthesis protein)
MNIVIGGDICPIGKNERSFKTRELSKIYNDLLFEFEKSDLSIINLECPLTDESSPILKNGPNLRVGSECVKGLPFDIVNLANNHILDQGESGLLNTIKLCNKNGITTVGAGKNLEAASKIIVKTINGLKVGIMGIAEHEYSIAEADTPGANPIDLIHIYRTIKKYRQQFEYLIVLVHAGISNYTLPSPKLRDLCHFLVELGANAIICQHSHCAGSYEKYLNAFIVYGQGNFIFQWPKKDDDMWNTGFLVKLTIPDSIKNHELQIIPYTQNINHFGARKMKNQEMKHFIKMVNDRSSKIEDSEFIENEWNKFCNSKTQSYINQLLNLPSLLNKLDRKFGFMKFFYNRKILMIHENIINCESHREVVETILGNFRKDESQ